MTNKVMIIDDNETNVKIAYICSVPQDKNLINEIHISLQLLS